MEYARKNNKQNGNIVCSTQINHKTVGTEIYYRNFIEMLISIVCFLFFEMKYRSNYCLLVL